MPPPLFLNEDITAEILARLPAKEIARLRCVCKQWLVLTSDPRFIKYHSVLNPHPSISGFFLLDHICASKYFPLNSNPPGLPDPSLSFIPTTTNAARLFIHSSCNGLTIFCQAIRRPTYKFSYYVCNPFTKEFVELSSPPEAGRNFSLAFDPSKSPHYNVVCMGYKLHIYSSETRSWKLSMDMKLMSEFGYFRKGRSVYWNGALVWPGKDFLLAFDVEGESTKKLPMPRELCESSKVVYIGESGGKLQMIGRRSSDGNVTYVIDIWEMDSERSDWSVLAHVDLSPMVDLYPQREPPWLCKLKLARVRQLASEPPEFKPVHFMRGGGGGGGGGDGILLLSIRRKIISYNLKDEAFTDVCDVIVHRPGSYYCMYDWHRFYPLSHTLCSP